MNVEEYKEHSIEINVKGEFEAKKDGYVQFKSTTMKALKKMIDKTNKSDVRGTKAIEIETFWGDCFSFNAVELISIIKTGRETFDVWIRSEGGHRSKSSLRAIVKPTEENKKMLEEMKNISDTIRKAKERFDELEGMLKHFTPKDFGLEEKEKKDETN